MIRLRAFPVVVVGLDERDRPVLRERGERAQHHRMVEHEVDRGPHAFAAGIGGVDRVEQRARAGQQREPRVQPDHLRGGETRADRLQRFRPGDETSNAVRHRS